MKKNRTIIFAIATLMLIPLTIRAEEQTRKVSGFNAVSFAVPANMEISQGDQEGLILIGDADDLDKIVTKVEGGELKIYKKKGTSNIKDVSIKLAVKELNELAIAGSGDVKFVTPFKTAEFELSISGSADVVCEDISAGEVEISIAGSGDVVMGGELSSELEISIAGSGDVNTSELKCPEVEVSIAGSGDAKVWAEEKLEASIVGSGNVYYKGRPLVDAEATGSGSTKPL